MNEWISKPLQYLECTFQETEYLKKMWIRFYVMGKQKPVKEIELFKYIFIEWLLTTSCRMKLIIFPSSHHRKGDRRPCQSTQRIKENHYIAELHQFTTHPSNFFWKSFSLALSNESSIATTCELTFTIYTQRNVFQIFKKMCITTSNK